MTTEIALVERGGRVAMAQISAGALPIVFELAPSGFWPNWNPLGDCLAVSTIAHGEPTASTVDLVSRDGEFLRELHRSTPNVQPVIGPRVPNYTLWSPRGDTLAIVGTSALGLTLFLSDREGAITSSPVLNGAPLFPCWSPDGSHLAVHAGPEIVVLEVDGNRRRNVLAERAVGFRAPVYSPDGASLAFALDAGEGVRVVAAEPDGASPRPLGEFPGGVALAFRPGTRELSVAITRSPDTGNFDDLWSIDLDSGEKRLLARGPFVSYYWSPLGDRLLTVVPAQTGDGRYALYAWTADGSFSGATEAFVPSQDFRTSLGFFDQYRLSHTPWTADGSAFIACGRFAGDAVSGSFGDPVGDYVLRWPGKRGAPLERLMPAVAAVPSPRATPGDAPVNGG